MRKLFLITVSLITVLLISATQAEVIGVGILGPGTFVSGVYDTYDYDDEGAFVKVKANSDRGPIYFNFEHRELRVVEFEGRKYITFYKTTCAMERRILRWDISHNFKEVKDCKLRSILKSDRGILYVETSIEKREN